MIEVWVRVPNPYPNPNPNSNPKTVEKDLKNFVAKKVN